MSLRLSTVLVIPALFLGPAVASAQPHPSSTDEARALAGSLLPRGAPGRTAPVGAIASSTDEARELAGRKLAVNDRGPVRSIAGVSGTDDVRAVAGGLLVVALAARAPRHEKVADCGPTCRCGHGR